MDAEGCHLGDHAVYSFMCYLWLQLYNLIEDRSMGREGETLLLKLFKLIQIRKKAFKCYNLPTAWNTIEQKIF